MEWHGEGLLLATRKHGETSVIASVFTKDQGRHLGVIRGGASRKIAPVLQAGNQLDLTWRARLEGHLGSFRSEARKSRTAVAMADPLALSGLNAVVGLLDQFLPEREPHPNLYDQTQALLDMLDVPDAWPLAYLRWEMALLSALGFGLDLRRCAVSGEEEDLFYISPKTGRAVGRRHAGEWAPKLLRLSPAMIDSGAMSMVEILLGLQVTGVFIAGALCDAMGQKQPTPARERLITRFQRLL
ncbi:MAG: DNA repair protein RecO [Halocynthiibacter sp.]